MKKENKLIIIILSIILLIMILLGIIIKTYSSRMGIYIFPPTPQEYVVSALSFMENGIYAEGEQWNAAKLKAKNEAKHCNSYEDTYTIIQEALMASGGKHSAIISAETREKTSAAQILPQISFNEGILYILLPPCSSDSNIQQEYINSVIGVIEKNEPEIKGAILDLRDNTGGDMGPMIAAVSPLLPDGTLMEFSVRGNLNAVTLNNGVVDGGGTTCKVDFTKKLSVPVAILQNELTASSGEATLICFKGLENVKTFGTDSAGYCSVNIVKYMYNGAFIQLTIGKDVDRKKNEYCENPIPPDMQTDIPLEEATNWIKMH